MKTIDIIEGFNQFFESKYPDKGHFISKLNIENCKVAKAIKTYTLELWHINGKNKELVFTICITSKITDGNEDTVLRDLNMELVTTLFSKLEDIGGTYGI